MINIAHTTELYSVTNTAHNILSKSKNSPPITSGKPNAHNLETTQPGIRLVKFKKINLKPKMKCENIIKKIRLQLTESKTSRIRNNAEKDSKINGAHVESFANYNKSDRSRSNSIISKKSYKEALLSKYNVSSKQTPETSQTCPSSSGSNSRLPNQIHKVAEEGKRQRQIYASTDICENAESNFPKEIFIHHSNASDLVENECDCPYWTNGGAILHAPLWRYRFGCEDRDSDGINSSCCLRMKCC